LSSEPYGRIVHVHESTIFELCDALNCKDYAAAEEIAYRMAAIDDRRNLRAAYEEAYRRMKVADAAGDDDAVRACKQICNEALVAKAALAV